MASKARSIARIYLRSGPLIVALAFGVLAWIGIELTRDSGRIAAVWVSNALLVSTILGLNWQRARYYLVACFAANLIVRIALGETLFNSLVFALSNIVEATLVYGGVIYFAGRRPDLSEFRALRAFCVIGGAIGPGVSATAAALVALPLGLTAYVNVWLSWALAHSIGMLIAAPLLISVSQSRSSRRSGHSGARAKQWVPVLGAGTLGTLLVFSQSEYPFLFMASLFVLFAAFRLGTLGAAASTGIVAVIASLATMFDMGPVHLVQGSMREKIMVLQIFLLFTFAGAMPVAAALAKRYRLEKELKESRDYANSILDNMNDTVFRTDAQGRWTFLNPAWERLTGYSIEEALGKPTTAYLLPIDRKARAQAFAPLIDGQIDRLVLQQSFVCADGEVRRVEMSVRALRDASGRFLGTTGNLRDITEQWRATEALRENERQFQTLADLSPAGIVKTDADGGLVYANRAWLAIVGISLDQAMADGWAASLHPDDRDWVVERWGEAVAKEEKFREEFRFVRGDGGVSWVLAQTSPEMEGDRIVGHVAVILDITDRVEARQATAERDEQLSLLADHATDAVFRMKLTGEFTYASPSVRAIFGVEPDDVVGQPIAFGVHRDDRDELLEGLARMSRGELDRMRIAYRTRRRDGNGWRWVESTAGLVRDEAGNPRELISSVRDVTDRMMLEEALRTSRDSAEAAARAKSAFLANMSHEIRTPMNGVMGFAELLANGDLAPDQKAQAELILESGRNMMALINDILDLSKVDAGQMSIIPEPVDLEHMICGSVRLMRAAATQKGLVLDASFAPDLPPTVLADKLRVRQILANLIGNAIKFTESGSVKVAVHSQGSGDAARLMIEVRDTGIGIPGDRIQAIFDEFVQADGSTARRFGGTGLGLAISRRLASLMDGGLIASSTEGEGSTFILWIPLVATDREAIPRDQFEPIASGPESGHRVLVAEDHDINQLLFSAMLTKLGYRVRIAADGAEAVRMVDEAADAGEPFKIVLMDMQMPEVDGVEATRRIRAAGHDADRLPIVALTANAYPEDIDACLSAGMQDHLSKPVRTEILAARIARWLGNTHPVEETNETREVAGPGTSASNATPSASASAKTGLAAKFAQRKAESIERIALLARQGALTGEALAEIADLAHKLAGTAGMFGESALGDRAHELEERVKSLGPGADAGELGPSVAALRDAA